METETDDLERLASEGEATASDEDRRLFAETLTPERRRAILVALTEKASAGDVRAGALLLDRIYGRPGASAKQSDEAGTVRLDLRRLDDGESENFARLFHKCIVDENDGSGPPRGRMERDPPPVPAGPGRLRQGDPPGEMVGEADGNRGGAAEA